MTEFFSQKQIDEIRECFNFYSTSGVLKTSSQLRCALRSLGYSPTTVKTQEYYRKQNKKPIEFVTFLDICKDEQTSPDPLTEIIKALSGLDRNKTRSMPSRELATVLSQVGERMSAEEIKYLLSKVEVNGMVPHQALIEYISR